MTEQQYEKLKANKFIYDFFLQVQTVNSAHPAIGQINEVLKELGRPITNMACSSCVVDGLTTAYNIYFEYERTKA